VSPPVLDEAQLILIAAAAAARAPEDVLASTDVAALARVSTAIEACDHALDVAAAALVGIAQEQPFGQDSNAVAWLACAMVAPVEAARVAVNRADAIDLVGRASRGVLTRELVREHLESGQTRCPACHRPVGHATTPTRRPPIRSAPVELVALCAVEHRAHGRFGQPFNEPGREEDTPWRPVIANRANGAMIVLADAAPLLLVPDGDSYVVAEPTFVAGDLVGDWSALIDNALIRTSVPADVVALDSQGSMIDWSRLDHVMQPALADA
jgi:hypothetical protein